MNGRHSVIAFICPESIPAGAWESLGYEQLPLALVSSLWDTPLLGLNGDFNQGEDFQAPCISSFEKL